jgi:hypothetical protein
VSGGSDLGTLSLKITRPEPRVALMEVTSPGYQEFFYVVAGERILTVTAFEATDPIHPEPRVQVLRKPHDWDMSVADVASTGVDDQDLLLRIWEVVGTR